MIFKVLSCARDVVTADPGVMDMEEMDMVQARMAKVIRSNNSSLRDRLST